MCLFTFQNISPLHAFPANSIFHILYDRKRLEGSAVRQLQSFAPAFSFAFASLALEVVAPLHVERPEVKLPRIKKLDDERATARLLSTSADVGLFRADYRLLV